MLKGKNIVIGVTGGIAVYKACDIVSRLKKMSANIDVIMTKNATEFVSPLTFESLSGNKVVTDMFNRTNEWEIEHIALAKKADAFVVVPATANIIGKMAQGIADDMLSTTLLATKKPIIVAPAMNSGMYTNDAFQTNLSIIEKQGKIIVSPENGRLACGDVGIGKLASVDSIIDLIVNTVMPKQDLLGKNILVTAGATIEKLDDVRYLTNYSSGKMGCEIAKNARERGANVTLILGRHTAEVPKFVNVVNVETTNEMFTAVMGNLNQNDIIIKAAAPCDFRPETKSNTKIKQKDLTIHFVANPDIAQEVGKIKGDKFLVVFSAETDHLIEYATNKMKKKNADMCIANNVNQPGAGFNIDTNIVTIIDKFGQTALPQLSKSQVAEKILDAIVKNI